MPSIHQQRPSKPAYIDKLLRADAKGSGKAVVRPPAELFLHLGYWPEPERAGSDYAELIAAQGRLNDRLLALAEIADGMRVLDVGCGIGGTIAAIAERHRDMNLVGLNIDSDQLQLARTSIQPKADRVYSWIEADACALPLRAASCDRVLAVECIFHFPSRRRFFAEAARVLKPGGMLVLSDFVVAPSMRSLRDGHEYPGVALEAAIVPAVGPWPDFWGDDADDGALAQAAGFVPVAREDATLQTLPSYRCFLHGKATDARLDAVDQAMVLVEWLQSRGHIKMEIFAFRRPR